MKLVAMIAVEIDDPLFPSLEQMADAYTSPSGVERMHQKVVKHVEQPGGVSRMIAVMPVEIAQSMMGLYWGGDATRKPAGRGDDLPPAAAQLRAAGAGMSDDTAIVLRALRCQRDRLLGLTDAATLAWDDPRCPPYPWFDRDAYMRDSRLRLASTPRLRDGCVRATTTDR